MTFPTGGEGEEEGGPYRPREEDISPSAEQLLSSSLWCSYLTKNEHVIPRQQRALSSKVCMRQRCMRASEVYVGRNSRDECRMYMRCSSTR